MHQHTFTTPQWLMLIASIAILNAWPFAFFSFTGDILVHHFFIDCFGREFWSGNLLPGWCSSANAGYGSPAPMFYFPLPYLLTTLLYPLTELGINTQQLHLIGLWALNGITLAGCYLWLRQLTSQPAAIAISLIYLWFPYRMELEFTRAAYAELWLMALLPYLFALLERERQQPGTPHFIAKTSLLCAALILSHTPAALAIDVAIILLFLCGYYPWRMFGRLFVGGMAALALTAIWWLPILQYTPYIVGNANVTDMLAYPNRHPNLQDIQSGRLPILMGSLLSVLLLLGISLRTWFLLPKGPLRTQLVAGLSCVIAGGVLFLPISEPLWTLIHRIPALGQAAFPWRMQLLFPIAAMLILPAYINAPRKTPFKKGDGYAFAVLLGFLSLTTISPGHSEYPSTLIRQANIGNMSTYHTIWMDGRYDAAMLIERAKQGLPPQARTVAGQATANIQRLDSRQIIVDIQAKTPATIELDHLYFPSWTLKNSNTTLTPASGSGLMQIAVPAGTHQVHIINQP